MPVPGARYFSQLPLQGLWNAPVLLLIAAMLFWSSNVIIGRLAAETIPPVALAFWRWVGAFLVGLTFAAPYLRRDIGALAKAWPIVAVLAMLGVSAYNTFLYVGLAQSSVLNASVLLSSIPVAILVVSFLLRHEQPTVRQIAGVAVSLFGVLIVAFRADIALLASFTFGPGIWWILAAVVSYAVYSVLLRKAPAVHPLSLLTAMFFVGLCFLAPFYVREHLQVASMRVGIASVATIIYVAAAPGFLAYLAYNRGVELLGANKAGLFLHLIPVFSSLWALLFLGEEVHLFHLAGGMLVVIGLLLALRTPRGRGQIPKPNRNGTALPFPFSGLRKRVEANAARHYGDDVP